MRSRPWSRIWPGTTSPARTSASTTPSTPPPWTRSANRCAPRWTADVEIPPLELVRGGDLGVLVDLVVVGPEAPLVAGVADAVRAGWIEAALRAGVSEHDLWFVVQPGPG